MPYLLNIAVQNCVSRSLHSQDGLVPKVGHTANIFVGHSKSGALAGEEEGQVKGKKKTITRKTRLH